MQIPHITIEQDTEQYITAEEARKLGVGKAECFTPNFGWDIIGYQHIYRDENKYRAIKQPEPHAEPHADHEYRCTQKQYTSLGSVKRLDASTSSASHTSRPTQSTHRSGAIERRDGAL